MYQRALRVGLLINGENIPNWLYGSLEKLQCDEYANIDLLITSSKVEKIDNSLFFNLYQKIDKKLFGSENDADKLKKYDTLFSNIPKLNMTDLEKIKEYDLDIIINISTTQEYENLIEYARYGVWLFDRVDSLRLFSEILDKNRLLQSRLLMVDKDGITRVETASSQILSYSLIRDKNEHLWTLASLLPREIKKLSKLGSSSYFKQKKRAKPLEIKKEPCMITAVSKQSFRVVKKIIEKKLFKEQWFLMYKDKREFTDIDPSEFKSIIPSVDQFWADPFVVEDGDKRYIFIEEEPLNSHGHISLITMQKDGSLSDAEAIIKKPYHLSYPFIFKYGEKYYMIPESSENRTVELYEAIDFPYKWEFRQNLMSDIHAVDTTLFYKDNLWWLFTSVTEFKGGWDNGTLSLFFSDDLFSSSWIEHPANPILTDPSSARMAGAIFEKDGKLYRPSQDCEKRYGYGFNLSEITKLTQKEYEEKIVTKVKPPNDKSILGVHTINFTDDFTIIDAVQMRSRFR